ncbi:peroxiredoxin [Acetobacter papayae]|uniref:peroxiredoxin n=1 Tax=Acetobacter papayae TaxID=1076592 RepID=UPI00046F5EDC|nr:peroxiredoxin [Acetobacter papayae]
MNDQSPQPGSAPPAAVSLRIGDTAPDFMARTTRGVLTLSSLRGQWVLLFSHPADFTPVCTSEFLALARAEPEFRAMGCALVGLSVDSLPAHLAWVEAIRTQFGVSVPFPIVEDPSLVIAQAYGMLDAAARNSATVRGTYFIDPQGIVRVVTWYPMTVGRSVDEMKRTLAALQRVSKGDVLTPEGWEPGGAVVLPAGQTQEEIEALGPQWFMKTQADTATVTPPAGSAARGKTA